MILQIIGMTLNFYEFMGGAIAPLAGKKWECQVQKTSPYTDGLKL